MLYLASDHRGYELKEKIKTWLGQWGVQFEDLGAASYDEQDDYPDFVHQAAQKVAEKPDENKAVILGGSGQGEAMVANRYRGVRAMVYYGGPTDLVAISRVHNNANVLSLGAAPGINIAQAKTMDDETAQHAVKLFLETQFSHEDRHVRRINKIELPV